ncbi:MAG: metallophosphoesterase family protein [Lachnospiraceae bacterium]|nr:metallophosphoesterase family protein [Lachnospiraceae bacterium]
MAILFTSDLHLGHQHILSIREQFSTIEEHDEFLIQSWNNKITKKDEVYILGDVSYRISNISHYLDRMKGRKHLIIGNHDSYWMKHMKNDELFKYFETIDHLKVIKFDKKNLTLCHYPMLEWSGSRYPESGTSFLIHGHIHNSKHNNTYEYIKQNLPHAFNAGVDINNFAPVTFEELKNNNDI